MLAHLIEVGEGHGLELGVDLDVVDGDLEGRPPAHEPLDLRIGDLGRDGCGKLPIARAVTSSAAVLDHHLCRGHFQGNSSEKVSQLK